MCVYCACYSQGIANADFRFRVFLCELIGLPTYDLNLLCMPAGYVRSLAMNTLWACDAVCVSCLHCLGYVLLFL